MMALLADAAVLLRSRALVAHPPARSLLEELLPIQLPLEFHDEIR